MFYWANKQTRRKNKRKLTGFRGHYREASSGPQTHNRNIYPLRRNKGVSTGSYCLHYQVNNNTKNNFHKITPKQHILQYKMKWRPLLQENFSLAVDILLLL